MLAELLTGLRDLRAPLAAGYVWLFGLWLTVATHLDSAGHPTGVLHDVDRLGQAAGKVAVTAAVTLAAYVVGVMSIAANPVITRIGNPFAATPFRHVMPRAQSRHVEEAVTALIDARIDERFLADDTTRTDTIRHLRATQDVEGPALPVDLGSDPDGIVEQSRTSPALRNRVLHGLLDTSSHVDACLVDLRRIPLRIIGNDTGLHAVYDRHHAEYELRMGLVLPLAYLVGTLTVRTSAWWAVGILAPAVLIYLGVAASIQAATVLTESVEARRLDLPTLENLATHALPWRDAVSARTHLASQ